jgi:predicted Fe-S protein YdhL (DUF1289 family)
MILGNRKDSPCILVCVYDYDKDFCTGCGRNLEEISCWNNYAFQEKEIILEKCKKNLDTLSAI